MNCHLPLIHLHEYYHATLQGLFCPYLTPCYGHTFLRSYITRSNCCPFRKEQSEYTQSEPEAVYIVANVQMQWNQQLKLLLYSEVWHHGPARARAAIPNPFAAPGEPYLGAPSCDWAGDTRTKLRQTFDKTSPKNNH